MAGGKFLYPVNIGIVKFINRCAFGDEGIETEYDVVGGYRGSVLKLGGGVDEKADKAFVGRLFKFFGYQRIHRFRVVGRRVAETVQSQSDGFG